MQSNAARPEPLKRDIVIADEELMRRDTEADAADEALAAPLRVEVFDTIEGAEALWRGLERTAVLTPYQRYDWIKALLDTRALGRQARCAVAVIRAGERPVALFPFAISRRFGLRTAAIIGADIGNAGWLVMEPDAAARLTPEALAGLFADIGRKAGGLDMVCLMSQPESWLGLANPLLGFAHRPAPDHLYVAAVTPGGAGDRLNGKRLRNIQRGRRRLEEALGPVVLRRAESLDDIARVHATFLEQRGARFAQMGVRNIFAEAWFVDFFKHAAATSLGSDRPALRFHALYAGDEIVATSCGTCCGTHYSQYINSTASGPAAKYSLMGILMHELVAELAGMGITSIDMGLGDFDYKTDWTDKLVVFDSIIPVTAVGRIAAPLVRGLRGLKREIKQNGKLFGTLKRLRAMTLNGKGGENPVARDSEEGK
jgi:CelD/BcsL family acetyltransferase involved in cellulose biosynthesis